VDVRQDVVERWTAPRGRLVACHGGPSTTM
jgi:hypothetical protein